MNWQLAISISIVANVTTTLIQRRYSLRSEAPETFPSATSYLLGVMPVGITTGLFILPHHVNWSWWLDLLLLICASSMAVSGWIGFRAVKLLPIAAYQTIGRFTSIVAITIGWVVLREGLSLAQLIGAIVLLAAALLAIWAPAKNIAATERTVHFRAVFLTLIAATTLGIGLTAEKGILGHMQPGAVLIFGWGSQTIAMLLLALKDVNRENIRKFRPYEIKWSTLMGFVNGITGAFYVYSLSKSNNISLITALTAITLPLIALSGHFLLGERENQKLMWVSVGISFVGLLVSAL
ncbi:MAG TPA: EamA family transporter [Verrucomicrobiae bacterium]|nr:EamA family transporter [Verrucomicrobiae bacterium]